MHTRKYSPRTFRHPKQKETLSISPAVRTKYREWHNEFEHDKLEGRNRKALPVGAFERYYRSRKAAFETVGGNSTSFNEEFDKIDSAQAYDSWSDLDSELKDKNIYASREDVSELKRKAREETRENRRIEREYQKYQREQDASAS